MVVEDETMFVLQGPCEKLEALREIDKTYIGIKKGDFKLVFN